MLKKILFFVFALWGAFSPLAYSGEGFIIPLEIVDSSENGDSDPKSPPQLLLTQFDNVLILSPSHTGLILQIRDDTGIVYSISIPSTTSQIVLPSTLAGHFELRLVTNSYYYLGFIKL